MTGRMSRCRNQIHFIAKAMIRLDKVDKAGIEDRLHGIGENRALFGIVCFIFPVVEFFARHQVPSIGKGRHPFSVDKHRVPADMVDMQVGTHHDVDTLARKAGFGHVLQKRALQTVPSWNMAALLVVSETGIDNNPMRRRLYDEGMNAHPKLAVFIDEMRLHPRVRRYSVGRCVGQDEL